MPRRHGIQLEILLSLLLVVMTATGIFVGLLFKTVDSRSRQIRSLMASALLEDAVSPLAPVSIPGQRWWTLAPDGEVRAQGGHRAIFDDESRELGREARARNAALLREGMPWEPIRFAAPLSRTGYVAVTYLPPAASYVALIAFILGDIAVFTVFGRTLLRRRVVIPMQRLAVAARDIADGALDSRLAIDVVHESAEVAIAFNEMAAALENRTCDLEKAVSELRESNRHLRDAREGLDRAERLAAVGRLAAGVAHEVGNPMGAMLAFLDLVRRTTVSRKRVRSTCKRQHGKANAFESFCVRFSSFRVPRVARAFVSKLHHCVRRRLHFCGPSADTTVSRSKSHRRAILPMRSLFRMECRRSF